MNHDFPHNIVSMNGMARYHPNQPANMPPDIDKKRRNYRLLADPMIDRSKDKIYRFDGVNPQDGRLVDTKDPRPRYQRICYKRPPADLPVPRWKYDQYYVGTPPAKEVTFSNLNDNISRDFLENMVKGFGRIEDVKIYYHPKNKKHMGIGKVVFAQSKSAKECVEKLHRTTKMGIAMNVVLDTMGKERQRLIDEKVADRPRIELEVKTAPSVPRVSSVDTLERFDYVEPENEKWSAYNAKKLHEHQRKEKGESLTVTSADNVSLSSQSTDFNAGTSFIPNAFTPGSINYDPQPLFVPPSVNPNIPFSAALDYSFNTVAPPPPFHSHSMPSHSQTPVHHGPPPMTPHHSHFSESFGPPPYGPSPVPAPMPFDIQPRFHVDTSESMPQVVPPPIIYDVSGNNSLQSINSRDDDRNWRRVNRHDIDVPTSTSTHIAGPSPIPGSSIPFRGRDPRPGKPPPVDMSSEKLLLLPDTPDADIDDEPRFMSLESRIQSLLQGGSEIDDKDDGKSGGEGGSESDLPSSPASQPTHKPHLHIPPQSQDIGNWNQNNMHVAPPPENHLPNILPPVHIAPPHHTPLPFVQSLPTGHLGPHSHQAMDMWSQNSIPSSVPWTSPSSLDGGVPLQSFEPPLSQNNSAGVIKERGKNHKKHFNRGGGKFGSHDPVFILPDSVTRPFVPENRQDIQKRGDNHISDGSIVMSTADPLDFKTKSLFLEESSNNDTDGQIEDKDTEDDRMSLDSVNSGDERLEVNTSDVSQQTFNEIWQNHQSGFDHFGMFISDYESDTDYVTQLFSLVLSDFVQELKSIMQRDICKKMVETSAFKYFEKWWDQQEEKHKQPSKLSSAEIKKDKPTPTSDSTGGITSALAGLFEARHPWAREGGLESGLGFNRYSSGGLLGIRSGMSKLPSFK
ncbi:unnamed protein product, partial [Candidula unifasciata]